MNLYTSELCVKCKGKGWCGEKCRILEKIKHSFPKTKTHFSGSSPPEIFVGRYSYPHINAGILSPNEYRDTEEMSLPEIWYEKNMTIPEILSQRSQLIYSRFKSRVLDARKPNKGKFLSTMQEISIASKPVSTEIFLSKPVRLSFELDKNHAIIGNPAPLKSITLQENPHVEKKVEYLTSDTDNKAAGGIAELYKSKIKTSHIIKILSAGMLGLKKNRKLVPTRWAVTATDDTLSKFLLEKIRYYQELGEIRLFHNYYIGNHYEILLLPDKFSFEVIEAFIIGSSWNPSSSSDLFTQDYESFFGRRKYASNVTGAYYTVRLAVAEYLEKIKKQATVLVLREERPEYNAPLGVGILRELARDAFRKKYETFNSVKEAFEKIKQRLKLNPETFREKSWLLKEYGKQTRLGKWF